MPEPSGLPDLGLALDRFLAGTVTPPAGTRTALGFLSGIPVDPDELRNDGVVNPALVSAFLGAAVDRVAPVVDGRFAGSLLSASGLYGALLAVGRPVDPPGTPAAEAFGALKALAGAAFGVPGAQHDVVATPSSWHDPAGTDGWATFSTGPPPAPEPAPPAPPIGGKRPRFDGQTPPINPRPQVEQAALRATRAADEHIAPAPRADGDAGMPPGAGLWTFRTPAPVRPGLTPRHPEPVAEAAARGDDAGAAGAVARLVDARAAAALAELRPAAAQAVEAEDLTLTLEFCVVRLSRDAWWNDVLLQLPGWYAPGLRAGGLVPGAHLAGTPVGVPIAMVVTRDVRISGAWSDRDRAALDDHAALGPWQLRRPDVGFVDQDRRTATLTVSGAQIVAVVCGLLPMLPPANDPALPAAA
jgi:hypothetical protein